MPKMYADLHCHPTLYNFNRMRNHPEERDPNAFHPWNVPASNLTHMDKGVRAAGYSQCDVGKLVKSKTRIVYASSTPIERGFFEFHSEDGKEHHPFAQELVRMVTGQTLLSTGVKFLKEDMQSAGRELTKILQNRGPLRVFLQKTFLKYGLKRIKYMMSEDYDYWREFLLEYEFWLARDGQRESAEVEHSQKGVVHSEKVTGTYHVVRDLEHFDAILETDDEVALIMTIEGGHVFTMGPNLKRVPEKVLFERLHHLKTLAHPVLFITIAHHFDNGICGHAHSVPDAAELVMNQRPRQHEGFERKDDLGLRVSRELYDLDDALEEKGGRRILIDFKHLAAKARRELYDEVIKPYNDKLGRSKKPKIPVFFSHGAYSGIRTIDELIANADRENDHFHSPPFYAWNINVCDEDMRMVHETNGLVGLVFDQRVCGVGPRHKIDYEMWPAIVRQQIFGLVDVVLNDDRVKKAEKKRVWDCVCLGTDYDGMIDPLTRYPTVLSLDVFAEDLRRELEAYKHTRFIDEIGVDALVEKICWENAYEFARRHLPAATR